MASERSLVVTATQQNKEKTLVLRSKLTQLGESTSSDMLWELSKLQSKLSQANPKERENLIQQIIKLFQSNMNQQLDDISKEVKSHKPEAPVPQQGQSDADFKKLEEEYNIAMENYKAYEAEAKRLIQQVMSIILEALTNVEEFCDPLWEMIKAKDKDIDIKVRSFVDKITNDMKKGLLKMCQDMSAETGDAPI